MIISTTNDVAVNTVLLIVGSLDDGDIENLKDPDFSLNATSSSATWIFNCGTILLADYIGLHGLLLPLNAVVAVTLGAFSDSFTITNTKIKNLVFHVDPRIATGALAVTITGAGSKTISYVAAGSASTVPNSGVRSGQNLSYLANNQRNRSAVTDKGMPTTRQTETFNPTVALSIPTPTKTFIRTELQSIFNLYNQLGVLSMRDYELDSGFEDESYAAFDLKGDRVKAHESTTKIAKVNLSYKVSV